MRRIFLALVLAALGALPPALGQGIYQQNQFLAGPTSGSGFPSPRVIIGGDLPNPSASTLGGVQSLTCAANSWLSSISIAGVPACTQLPAFTGDTTTSAGATVTTTGKVNGVSFTASPSVDTTPVVTAANTSVWTGLPNCASALQYSTSTHQFACGLAGAPTDPQGRVTLTSGTAITTTDVLGALVHYYTPAPGQYLPITLDGVNFVMMKFYESSQATTDAVKSPAAVANNSVYDILGWLDSSTVTVTIASPAVVTWTANGFRAGAAFTCTTSGTLPTGLTASTPYYVISAGLGANSYEFSATAGGSAINTSGSQSGVHTCTTIRTTRGPAWTSDTNPGTGAGTSERDFTTAFPTNKVAVTNGPAANRGIVLGCVRSNGSAQLMDSVLFRWVSNVYRAVPRNMAATDATASWNYTTAQYRYANGNANNAIDFLQCMSGGLLLADASGNSSNSNVGPIQVTGIGIGQVTVNNANHWSVQNSPTAGSVLPTQAHYAGYPGLGRTFAAWLEYSAASGTTTWYSNLSPGVTQTGISGSINN